MVIVYLRRLISTNHKEISHELPDATFNPRIIAERPSSSANGSAAQEHGWAVGCVALQRRFTYSCWSPLALPPSYLELTVRTLTLNLRIQSLDLGIPLTESSYEITTNIIMVKVFRRPPSWLKTSIAGTCPPELLCIQYLLSNLVATKKNVYQVDERRRNQWNWLGGGMKAMWREECKIGMWMDIEAGAEEKMDGLKDYMSKNRVTAKIWRLIDY